MVAIALVNVAAAARHRALVPRGIRALAGDLITNRTTLRDARLGLVGRPRSVLRRREHFRQRLVAEVRPGPAPLRPARKHVLRLAACVVLLRARHRWRAAPYGFLVYDDRSIRVDLTGDLRREVTDAADRVRALRAGAPTIRNHGSARRCASCPFRITVRNGPGEPVRIPRSRSHPTPRRDLTPREAAARFSRASGSAKAASHSSHAAQHWHQPWRAARASGLPCTSRSAAWATPAVPASHIQSS